MNVCRRCGQREVPDRGRAAVGRAGGHRLPAAEGRGHRLRRQQVRQEGRPLHRLPDGEVPGGAGVVAGTAGNQNGRAFESGRRRRA